MTTGEEAIRDRAAAALADRRRSRAEQEERAAASRRKVEAAARAKAAATLKERLGIETSPDAWTTRDVPLADNSPYLTTFSAYVTDIAGVRIATANGGPMGRGREKEAHRP